MCEPFAQTCEDNLVVVCRADGSGTSFVTACGDYHHCVEVEESARCEANACPPSSLACDGNVLKTCTASGTFPAKGKSCGDDVCENGACVPQICEPSSHFCKDGSIYECSSGGTRELLVVACDARFTCIERDDVPECVTRVCDPGKGACVDEISGTCGEDGMSLATSLADCSETEEICDVSSGCGPSASDALGKREEVDPITGGDLATNVMDVHSSRELLELEVNWLLEQPRDLRFVVYEWTEDHYEVRYNEITSHNSGSGFFSSGPINVPLEAGKRYLVGAGPVVGEGYAYYDVGGWVGAASFAGLVGGGRIPHRELVALAPGEWLYVMRLKTGPMR